MRVVQRRLFADLGDVDVHRAVARAYADLLRRQLEANAETDDGRRQAATGAGLLEQRIVASYPFHPELLDLMYHRWGSLPSYQRTRGALQFLACTAHALRFGQGGQREYARVAHGRARPPGSPARPLALRFRQPATGFRPLGPWFGRAATCG